MSKQTSGDMWVHQPLPYVVVARVIASEDLAPEQHVIRVVAYSLQEAMFQTTIRLGAVGLDDANVKIEHIEPDLVAFAAMMTAARQADVETGA